jgi:hypothetical protein
VLHHVATDVALLGGNEVVERQNPEKAKKILPLRCRRHHGTSPASLSRPFVIAGTKQSGKSWISGLLYLSGKRHHAFNFGTKRLFAMTTCRGMLRRHTLRQASLLFQLQYETNIRNDDEDCFAHIRTKKINFFLRY